MRKNSVKTGIITLHRNINYGANLQAYALCQFLNQNDIPACVIDYLSKEQDKENHILSLISLILRNEPNKSPKRMIKLFLATLLMIPNRAIRLHKFKKFRKENISLSPYCKNDKDIERLTLDTIVCGSDQIWNAQITDGINPIYYGNIPGISKIISYAASMGSFKFSEEQIGLALSLLKNVSYCSVREDKTKTYLESLGKQNIECVCDPVFLLDADKYKNLAGKRRFKQKYVLVYSIVNDSQMVSKAREYAKLKGLRFVEICSQKKKNVRYTQLVNLGPKEFLNAFCYADTIFTNSFHGTAFSIILEKNFYIFDNKNGGSRLTNLLEKAKLNERLIEIQVPLANLSKTIDYAEVKNNLKAYIAFSKKFLLNAVKTKHEFLAGNGCVGCGACSKICPVGAINMLENTDGFSCSVLNRDKCIKCGKCEKVCPALRDLDDTNDKPAVYAFKASKQIRMGSTSGGAFTALADYVLQNNGIIYGATMTEGFAVKHLPARNDDELAALKGVKYVQSDITECFEKVCFDLTQGKSVMFTGTPCQVSAIKAFVEQKNVCCENLYLVDIICHGVPSPLFFAECMQWAQKRLNCKIVKYNFRDKEISWRGNSSSIVLEDGRKISSTAESNAFMNVYYSNCITRQACYQCRYANIKRVSDITISDYWGIENVLSEFEDSYGVSMILVNTKKGNIMTDKIQGEKVETDLSKVKQPRLIKPCERPSLRNVFWKEYIERGTNYVIRKYAGVKPPSVFSRIKNKLYKMLKE